MISMVLTIIGLVLYVGLRHFLSHLKNSDGSLQYKKSNQFSSFIYFCGVAYLIYKVNKRHSSASNLLIHSLISISVISHQTVTDSSHQMGGKGKYLIGIIYVATFRLLTEVIGSIITLDIMMTVIWGKIECLMLEVLPACLQKVLNKIGYDFETELPFVLMLWGISFLCVMVAHRSDSILERIFKSSHDDEVTDCPSFQILEIHSESTTDNEDDEVVRSRVHIAQVHDEDPRLAEGDGFRYPEIPINYRGVNTLPSEFISTPPRRSLRCRSRQCVFAHQK